MAIEHVLNKHIQVLVVVLKLFIHYLIIMRNTLKELALIIVIIQTTTFSQLVVQKQKLLLEYLT